MKDETLREYESRVTRLMEIWREGGCTFAGAWPELMKRTQETRDFDLSGLKFYVSGGREKNHPRRLMLYIGDNHTTDELGWSFKIDSGDRRIDRQRKLGLRLIYAYCLGWNAICHLRRDDFTIVAGKLYIAFKNRYRDSRPNLHIVPQDLIPYVEELLEVGGTPYLFETEARAGKDGSYGDRPIEWHAYSIWFTGLKRNLSKCGHMRNSMVKQTRGHGKRGINAIRKAPGAGWALSRAQDNERLA